MKDFEAGQRVLVIEGGLTRSGTIQHKCVYGKMIFYTIELDFGGICYKLGNKDLACPVDKYLYDIDFKDKIKDRIK